MNVTTFADLPNEIVEKVLTFLSTKKLLKCRLVSHNWDLTSSAICRQRFLKLNDNWVHHQWKKFNSVFKGRQNVPWSSFRVQGNKEDNEFHCYPEQTAAFFSLYGIHVRELLIFANHFQVIKKFLQYLPKLEHLRAIVQKHLDYEDLPEDEDDHAESDGEISLRMLRTVEIFDSGIGALELLKAVGLNSGIALRNLTFRFIPTSTEYADEVASLLTTIPSVELQLFSDCNYFFTKSVRISTLELTDSGEICKNYAPLQQFLQLISKHLKVLKICCQEEHPVESQLRIPTLPNLRSLQLEYSKEGADAGAVGPPRAFTFLHPLTPQQFPRLRNLRADGDFSKATFLGVFNPTTPFASVRSFSVSDWDMANELRMDWFQLLPNLTQFYGIVNHANFTQIWRRMNTLEELSVTLVTEDDVTAVLLDILDPVAISQLVGDRTQAPRSFVTMPGLKKFSVIFSGNLKKVTDHGVSLSLLLLPSLQSLTIHKVHISEESRDNLRRHHKHVSFSIFGD